MAKVLHFRVTRLEGQLRRLKAEVLQAKTQGALFTQWREIFALQSQLNLLQNFAEQAQLTGPDQPTATAASSESA